MNRDIIAFTKYKFNVYGNKDIRSRETCGDLWLGFAPEELSRWGSAAGLDEGESVYLALRNGFRIQVRVFHRRA